MRRHTNIVYEWRDVCEWGDTCECFTVPNVCLFGKLEILQYMLVSYCVSLIS